MKSLKSAKFALTASLALVGTIGIAPAFSQSAPTSIPEATEAPELVEPSATPVEQMPGMSMPDMQPTPASGTTPATPATSAEATGNTIVDVAAASDTFKTLVAALTEAELLTVLQGEGPFTVFAPTDAAFAALPPGTVEELLKPENRETLVKVLKYHVVSGALASADLTSGEVPTVEGSSVNVTVSSSGVTVDDANVVQADILASNGIIHAIDQVILPSDL